MSSQNHRRNLRRSSEHGLSFVEDLGCDGIADFEQLYIATMDRVEAPPSHYFPTAYYQSLREELGGAIGLFHAMVQGAVVSSVLVFRHAGIVQYHLGGTDNEWAPLGASRWLLEETRKWAKGNSYEWFHLGGGVGASEDSLFRFKAGFSKEFRRFRVVRWIVDPDAYKGLVDEAHHPPSDFFPAYRA